MKICIKKIILLLCILLTVFSLAACSNALGAFGVNEKDTALSSEEIENINKLYDEAKTLGYDGTLEDFLELITGDNGKHGKDGQHGLDGVSIKNSYIDENGHLILIISDGRALDIGELPSLAPSESGIYKVTFDLGDGETFEQFSKDYGIDKPTNPQKEGYEFLGWTYYEPTTDSYEFWRFGAYAVSSDLTLYASWKESALAGQD